MFFENLVLHAFLYSLSVQKVEATKLVTKIFMSYQTSKPVFHELGTIQRNVKSYKNVYNLRRCTS